MTFATNCRKPSLGVRPRCAQYASHSRFSGPSSTLSLARACLLMFGACWKRCGARIATTVTTYCKRVAYPTLQGTQMDRCIGSNLRREYQRGNWVGLALTGVRTATIVRSCLRQTKRSRSRAVSADCH
ncbi:hypothetical protein F01_320107 [Burkholderia cenocepacia]|nr:hypothetical protein F01_320107 [Burkholderia cenocepacia]